MEKLVPSLLKGLIYTNDDLINIMDSESTNLSSINKYNLEEPDMENFQMEMYEENKKFDNQ